MQTNGIEAFCRRVHKRIINETDCYLFRLAVKCLQMPMLKIVILLLNTQHAREKLCGKQASKTYWGLVFLSKNIF
jgi:hypothetical protein